MTLQEKKIQLIHDRPLLRGWHWRLLGWAVALFVLGSIGYAIIVLLAALLESGSL